jgi:glycerol-3-phosphate acyltransferase PlsY
MGDFKGGKGVALYSEYYWAFLHGRLFHVWEFLAGAISYSFCFAQLMLASIAFPVFILVIFNVDNPTYRIFAVAIALLVLLTHQKNIEVVQRVESKIPILKHRDKKAKEKRQTFFMTPSFQKS